MTGRGTARAEDAQGIPTQRHTSPSILVNEENRAVSTRITCFLKPAKTYARGLERQELSRGNTKTVGFRERANLYAGYDVGL